MTTGGGGLVPPQEGTRPPDEESARPTVEEKDDHAADERAGSGGSPGGSPDAPRDGGSGQELPNVSRGDAPSTTIGATRRRLPDAIQHACRARPPPPALRLEEASAQCARDLQARRSR